MIPSRSSKVLVYGFTGRQGTFWSHKMLASGTNIVGGVNPKKGGTEHLDRPVHASASEAVGSFDVAVMFVPPLAARQAAIDAIEAGASMVVCLTEHIPVHDVMEMVAAAATNGCRLVGPNTSGIVVPGDCAIGIMPADNQKVFRAGSIAVISRSGSLGTLICLQLVREGSGQSVFFGVGGDPILGTTSREALEILDSHPGTEAIVLCGEIGGTAEEQAAAYAQTMKKPVVAYVAGRSAPVGRKMGHAGAIVSGDMGTYRSKKDALERAGVPVASVPREIGPMLKDAMSNVPFAAAS